MHGESCRTHGNLLNLTIACGKFLVIQYLPLHPVVQLVMPVLSILVEVDSIFYHQNLGLIVRRHEKDRKSKMQTWRCSSSQKLVNQNLKWQHDSQFPHFAIFTSVTTASQNHSIYYIRKNCIISNNIHR